MAYGNGNKYTNRYGSGAANKSSAAPKKTFFKKNEPIVKIPFEPMLHPTDQQAAIIDNIIHGSGNLVVRARAGTGKTKTILQAISQLPTDKTGAYLVFGNRNAREAEAKMPNNRVEIYTHHALGFRAQKAAFGKIHLDTDKMPNIVSAIVGFEDEKIELCYNVEKAISLCKGYLAEDESTVIDVCDSFGVEYCDVEPKDFAAFVLKGMEMSLAQKHRLAFDDMIYGAIKHKVRIPQFDYVFIDEANDCSKGRLLLSISACKPGGRLIFCGDSEQCIFVFTGAGLDTMERIIEDTNAATLPMSITHRCAKAIVREAQKIVPDYIAAEHNPEGEVRSVSENFMIENAKYGDLILSRNNAALVPIAMHFWKQRKRAAIQGKDFSKNLLFTIKRSEANTLEEFLVWISEWKNTEVDKLSARKRDYSHITDKYEVLTNLSDDCKTLDELRNNIRDLFEDVDGAGMEGQITLSTTHKFKGLECRRVFMLTETFKPDKGKEEANIYYTAITRARESLFFVGKGSTVSDTVVAEADKEVLVIE